LNIQLAVALLDTNKARANSLERLTWKMGSWTACSGIA
jgi:hypothetical protein